MHARARAHTHTHTVSDEGMGRAVKNSLEIVIKQVRLEGGFNVHVLVCVREHACVCIVGLACFSVGFL